MKIKTELRGLDDVDRLLSQIAPRKAFNIMRATVHDMAAQVSKEAKEYMPRDTGDMVEFTKHRRENPKDTGRRLGSTVRVGREAFYWRYLEYGQGPDGVEHGFFAAAVQSLKVQMNQRFLASFVKKFEAALRRARK